MNLASDTGEKLVYSVSCVKVRHFLQGFWFVSVCEVGVTTYHMQDDTSTTGIE